MVTAGVAAASASLVLTPNHGLAGTSFTAYLSDGAPSGCLPSITFKWDGGQTVGKGTFDQGTCTAKVTLAQPAAGDGPGTHIVEADYYYTTGVPATVRAVFTVDTPPPSPTPTPAPVHKPTPHPTAAATATPTATPPPTATAPPAASTATPLASPTPGATPPSATPAPAPSPGTSPGHEDPGPAVGLLVGSALVGGSGAAMWHQREGSGRGSRPRRDQMFAYPSEPPAVAVPFLGRLYEDEIATLLRHSHVRRFAAGESVNPPGAGGRDLYVVMAGRFRSARPEGPEVTLEPGDVAGDVAFLEGARESPTLTAVEPGELMVITPVDLDRLRLRHPRIAHRLIMDVGRAVAGRGGDG